MNSPLVGGGNRVVLDLIDRLPRDEYEPWALVPGRGPVAAELRARSVRVLTVSPATVRPRGRASQVWSLLELVARWRWRRLDLLHAQGPLSYRLSALAIPARARLCHLHGRTVMGLRWAFRRRPHRLVACGAGIGELAAAALARDGLDVPLAVVPNGVDVERWRPAPRTPPTGESRELEALRLPAHDRLVLLSSSLGPHKRVEDFLRLAAILVRESPRTLCVVAGEDIVEGGAYRRRMEDLAAAMGLAERVRFTGYLRDPLALTQHCDVFVATGEAQGLSLAILEAAACARPAVAYAVAGIEEAIVDGATGLLAPDRDVQALADAVLTLLGDDDRRRSLGAAARRRVAESFSLDRHVAAIRAIYEEVLERSGTA